MAWTAQTWPGLRQGLDLELGGFRFTSSLTNVALSNKTRIGLPGVHTQLIRLQSSDSSMPWIVPNADRQGSNQRFPISIAPSLPTSFQVPGKRGDVHRAELAPYLDVTGAPFSDQGPALGPHQHQFDPSTATRSHPPLLDPGTCVARPTLGFTGW
ncbi:hypothetical protein VTI74DRAFT_2114 [Chaetomium olivicolor]